MLIENLDNQGWAILNMDNERSYNIRHRSKAKVLTYGFKNNALLKAQELNFNFFSKDNNFDVDDLFGINFKLNHNGSIVPVTLPKVIGYQSIYAALVGAAVGIIYKMNLIDISQSLRNLKSPKGRMNLIKGIKNTMIIDDTYNSSPESSIMALNVIEKLKVERGRKIAVLGDMLELGSYSEEGHKKVGKECVKAGIERLIIVGEKSRDIGNGAQIEGLGRDNIFHFDTSEEAGKFVQEEMKEFDVVFVKGSQGARMEKVVEEIMADPLSAKDLLVRQGKGWE